MDSAKFLVLAMEAFRARKFEEAGSLFAQANECPDSAELQGQLLQAINVQVPEQAMANSDVSDTEDDEARVISVSNAQRRVAGKSRIKQMLAAALEATAAEEEDQDEGGSDFDDDLETNPEAVPEFDPDVPGAKLLPVSFSSESGTVSPVRVKSR